MKDIIRRVIHEWNPFGLLPHAPDDEFDSEINKVAETMAEVNTVEELASKIQDIFSSSFGEPFGYEECFKRADQIWGLVHDRD